jgi:hypothetical protein
MEREPMTLFPERISMSTVLLSREYSVRSLRK